MRDECAEFDALCELSFNGGDLLELDEISDSIDRTVKMMNAVMEWPRGLREIQWRREQWADDKYMAALREVQVRRKDYESVGPSFDVYHNMLKYAEDELRKWPDLRDDVEPLRTNVEKLAPKSSRKSGPELEELRDRYDIWDGHDSDCLDHY